MRRFIHRFGGRLGLIVCVVAMAKDPVRAADSGPPPVPTGFAVTQNGLREVTLSWTPPSSGSVHYRIERAESADGKFETVGDIASRKGAFTDAGTAEHPLEDSKEYFYRLVAYTSGGETSAAGPIASKTAPPPDPPGGLKAEAAMSRGVKLSWTASTSDAVVKYRIERAEAAKPETFAMIAELPATEFTDGGTASSMLKDSTPYLYRVTSINRVNSAGRPCDAVKVTTMPPPDAPAGLTAGSTEVRCVPLAWQPNKEEDVVRYDVFRATSKSGPFEKIGSVQKSDHPQFLDGKTDPGILDDDTDYFYRIRAINAVTSESADSATVKATTREVPPRIEGVTVGTGQPREVPLSWQQSPDEKVIGYEIWRAEGDGEFSVVGRVAGRTTTTFVDRGGFKQFPELSTLKDATAYRFKILAFNTAYARSSASAQVVSRTKPSPAPPKDGTATTNLPRAIVIAWAANTETDIVAYAVEASSDGQKFQPLCSVAAVKDAPRVLAREDGLADGTDRRYRIRAVDRTRLVSPWTETIAGRAKPVPDAPAGLKLETNAAGTHILWTPPPQPDIKAYKLYTKSTFGSAPYAVTDTPGFTVEWPLLKSTLKLLVTAVDADNLESPRSEQITINPRP